MSREIAFIDSSIPDFGRFICGLRPGIEAIPLGRERAAPEQIADALCGRVGLDAIHIVAHGKPGEVSFASGVLSLKTLNNHSEELAEIGGALASHGELLLWACETARGARGRAFIEALERETGAQVAAATGLVGSAAQGGLWELDGGSKTSERTPLTAQGASAFAGVLALQLDLDTTTAGNDDTSTYTENDPNTPLFGFPVGTVHASYTVTHEIDVTLSIAGYNGTETLSLSKSTAGNYGALGQCKWGPYHSSLFRCRDWHQWQS